MDSRKVKKSVLNNLAYVIFGYVGNIICFAFRTAEGKNISEKILPAMTNLGTAFARILPSFNPIDLLIGIAVGVAMKFFMKMRAANKKKFRQGTEYGSAVWGEQKDIEPYMDLKDKDNNVILTQTEGLTMGKPSSPKYARNKNILVIGGSGSGKTRFFVKPNLMQMHSSYIVTDPKGTVLIECGKMLQRGRPVKDENGRIYHQPYRIKVFNTIDFGKSMHYNPFAYISKKNREKDILKFVDVLIKNTQSSQQNGGDDFWVKAEKLLYTAYIAMIFTINPPKERNFETLIEMINSSECREDDETFKNAMDRLFEFIECWIGGEYPDGYEISNEFLYMKDKEPTEEQKSSEHLPASSITLTNWPQAKQQSQSSSPVQHVLHHLPLMRYLKSQATMNLDLTSWVTNCRHFLSSFRIRTQYSIFLLQLCILSCSICCVPKPTIQRAES